MTEVAMYAALGFLVAALLALSLLPAVNRRAERLAKRRMAALFPLSIDELNAQKDHLRAQFAVEQRRLERKLDKAVEQRAQDLAELGRKEAAIVSLEETVARYLASVSERDSQISDMQNRLDAESSALADANAMLAQTRSELASTAADLDARSEELDKARALIDTQRADISALEVRAAAADVRIEDLTELVHQREASLAQMTEQAGALGKRLEAEQLHASALEDRIASLEAIRDEQSRRIGELNAEAKDASSRLTELSAQASRREAVIAQRDSELSSLRLQAERLAKQAAAADGVRGDELRDLKAQLADLSAENSTLKAALEQARSDRAALKREINRLVQDTKTHDEAFDKQHKELRAIIDRTADEVVRAVSSSTASPLDLEQPRRTASRA